jgi:hypothetical protein
MRNKNTIRSKLILPLRSIISLLFPVVPLSTTSLTAIQAEKTSLSSSVIVKI